MIIVKDWNDPRVVAFMAAKGRGYDDGYNGRTPELPADDPDLEAIYVKGYGEGHADAAFLRVQRGRGRA